MLPPAILSSWKEIAHYLGKGVRTVQRWERSNGLPVHRPESSNKGLVFAHSAELDAWIGSRTCSDSSDVLKLRSDISQLQRDNERLSEELAFAMRELAAFHDGELNQLRIVPLPGGRISGKAALLSDNLEAAQKRTSELIERSFELVRLTQLRRSGYISWGSSLFTRQ